MINYIDGYLKLYLLFNYNSKKFFKKIIDISYDLWYDIYIVKEIYKKDDISLINIIDYKIKNFKLKGVNKNETIWENVRKLFIWQQKFL